MPSDLTSAGLRDSILSLSLGSGAIIVVVLSAFLTWVLSKLVRGRAVWVIPFTVSPLISYSLYWLPFWMVADDLQARQWAVLFIIPWSIIGVGASGCVVILVRRLH